MRIEYIAPSKIKFTYTTYPDSLLTSIDRIGLNFPILCRLTENDYECIDGHKRMSAITDLLKKDKTHPKLQNIPLILSTNNRTQSPYTMHNHH